MKYGLNFFEKSFRENIRIFDQRYELQLQTHTFLVNFIYLKNAIADNFHLFEIV